VEKAEAKAFALFSTPFCDSMGSAKTLLMSLYKSPRKASSSLDSFGIVILVTSNLEDLIQILPSRGI
jgi:hypothetical protein